MTRAVFRLLPVLAISALEALSCGRAPSEDCSRNTTQLRTELVCPDTNDGSEGCNAVSVSDDDRFVLRQLVTIPEGIPPLASLGRNGNIKKRHPSEEVKLASKRS